MMASKKMIDMGTLAAGVAHELNSPLQVITGFSESLLRAINSGEHIDADRLFNAVDAINRNAWRSAEIVRSLFTYVQAPSDKNEPQDLNDLVRDTLLLIKQKVQIYGHIQVNTELAADMPEMNCNRQMITQVLVNLFSNASDAMPQGGVITIRTSYDSIAKEHILQFSDSGIGVPEAIRERIFDPFFSTKPFGYGTGLGLSIVQGIVHSYGGKIILNSEPGKGTMFTIHFPQWHAPKVTSSSSASGGRFNRI